MRVCTNDYVMVRLILYQWHIDFNSTVLFCSDEPFGHPRLVSTGSSSYVLRFRSSQVSRLALARTAAMTVMSLPAAISGPRSQSVQFYLLTYLSSGPNSSLPSPSLYGLVRTA